MTGKGMGELTKGEGLVRTRIKAPEGVQQGPRYGGKPYPIVPNPLIGWEPITGYLKSAGYDSGGKINQLFDTSRKSLQWHTDKLDFPIFEDEEGNVCLYAQDVNDWLMTFQNADEWWPNGRPSNGSRVASWEV